MLQYAHSTSLVFTHPKKSDPILVILKQVVLTQGVLTQVALSQIASRQRRTVSESQKYKAKNRNKLRSFFHNGVSTTLAIVASKQKRGD